MYTRVRRETPVISFVRRALTEIKSCYKKTKVQG